jgi:AraC family transcriptional regulator, exoenzyme S synthesis regulatory protein ExsA
MAERKINQYVDIVLSCSENNHYRGEMIWEDHSLVRIISGELKVVQADRSYIFHPGDALLFPRNQLSTLIKYEKDEQPYKALVMRLTTSILRDYYTRNKIELLQPPAPGILSLGKHPLLESLFTSILPYFELENKLPEKLTQMKIVEAIEVLRSIHPNIDAVLSDFSEAGKINLADYMEKHYMFNIPLEKFSTLTGRSLTTFKRDFKKAFHTTPQRWLTQKRLELAHYQLAQQQRKPVDVYYETGFENLSHFSHAFKKHFGYAPTTLLQHK